MAVGSMEAVGEGNVDPEGTCNDLNGEVNHAQREYAIRKTSGGRAGSKNRFAIGFGGRELRGLVRCAEAEPGNISVGKRCIPVFIPGGAERQ
jgi:hypothetical protein